MMAEVNSEEPEGVASQVASHYNSVKETGIAARSQARIYHLRNFNNWIKGVLISEELRNVKDDMEKRHKSTRKLCVLDLCSGKGGDIMKWLNGPVQHVVFADIAEVCMEHCKKRYSDLRFGAKFSAEFITADCTKVPLPSKLKDPTRKFDLVSCQFAFHYCFESLPQAEIMLRNASMGLGPGGRFIGSMPNAYEIVKRLEDNDGSYDNEIFHIKSDLVRPYPIFGAKYDFKLEDVVECPEFLVHFPTFVRLAKKFGLKLVYAETFPRFFDRMREKHFQMLTRMSALETYPAPESGKLNASLEHYSHADKFLKDGSKCTGTLSKPEWEVASIYLVFCFEKVDCVSRDGAGNPVFDI